MPIQVMQNASNAVNTAAAGSQQSTQAGNQASGDFANLLVQVIGTGGTAQAANGSLNAQQTLAAINPSLLQSLFPEAGQDNVEQLLGSLLQTVQNMGDEQKKQADGSEDIQSLLMQLQAMLAAMMSKLTSPQQQSAASSADSSAAAPVLQQNQTTLGKALETVLSNLLSALQQTVGQPAVKTDSAPFLQVLTALANKLEQIQQTAAAGQQTATMSSSSPEGEKAAGQNVQIQAAVLRTASASTMAQRQKAGNSEQSSTGQLVQFIQASSPKAHFTLAPLAVQHIIALNATNEGQAETSGDHAGGETTANTQNLTLQTAQTAQAQQTNTAGKAATSTIHSQHFAQEMSQFIVKNMNLSQFKGFSEAKITLLPENLGQVNVRITLHNGQLMASFVTDTLLSKDILENQLPQLRAALQSQGLQVEKLVVSHNQVDTGMFQDQRRQQPSGQSFNRGQQQKNGSYEQAPIDFMNELEAGTAARTLFYGNSFNVTA